LPSSSSRPGLGADRDDGAHRVEEVGQHEREDEQAPALSTPIRANPPNSEKFPSSERSGIPATLSGQVGTVSCQPARVDRAVGADRRARVRDRVHDQRDDGAGQDAEQDRAADPERDQDRHDRQAEHEHQHRPAAQAAGRAELDRHGAGRRAPHDAGVDQPDQGQEQPDADRDRRLQLGRDGPEHRDPEVGQHEQGDDQALEHDQAHRVRPGHLRGHRDRQEGVEPEPGRERDRQPAEHAHRDRGHRGDQCGHAGHLRDAEDAAVRVLGQADDQRVEHDDVGHRHEGHEAAAHLTADRRAALGDPEVAVEPAPGLGGGIGRRRHGG
jgi:hypothetical protein